MSACNNPKKIMTYHIHKLDEPHEINAVWEKYPWKEIPSLQLNHIMGEKPDHFPRTEAKLAYDNESIYVIFRVQDRFVLSKHSNHQDPVYKDSCVEFFFIPGEDTELGYFNLEMNCGGTMLFHHQLKPREGSVDIHPRHISEIEVAASLPKIVDPEIKSDTTWVVEYRIPFSILKDYFEFNIPGEGSLWRANFYKCADESSHPHWLTWAPVQKPTPDFHMPEFFGHIEFH
jgi:hypothetical protein